LNFGRESDSLTDELTQGIIKVQLHVMYIFV